MGTRMEHIKETYNGCEWVCLNCGLTLTPERGTAQMDETGFDKPVCCGGAMILEEIED